ncbi:protein LKAAEAR1 [Rhinophrynus dorsalis]
MEQKENKNQQLESLPPHIPEGSLRVTISAEETGKLKMDSGETSHKGKVVPKKWKNISPGDVRKLPPIQRAKYMAYEQPSKDVAASLLRTQKRVKEHALRSVQQPQQVIEDMEKERQLKVVGQLKAAEARNRIRLMRLRFQCMKAQELNHLVSCQPTARDAIRLEVFLPARPDTRIPRDTMNRFQRERVEGLLEDNRGLLTNRIT